jgi:hypothetical protein
MEINSNILIGLLFVAILVLLFSKVSVSLESDNSNTIPQYQRPVINRNGTKNTHPINQPLTSSRGVSLAESQGLPNKDAYMSNALRSQLNDLENKFYYNNCRWEPNF